MARVSPFIMKTRNTSQNYIRDEIVTGTIDQYIKEKKAAGMSGFNLMYVLIAAYVRMLSQYPGLNRFIAGQEVFARHNIEICLTIKKEMDLHSPDTVIKAEFEPDATAEEVYERSTGSSKTTGMPPAARSTVRQRCCRSCLDLS